MSGDQPNSPIPARDFTAAPIVARPDPLVQAATEYAFRRGATPEETDRMLRRIYGPDRIPGTESRRRSQMGEAKTCGMTECVKPARSCGWCFDHCNAIHRHGSCSVEGCTKPRRGRRLCGTHYMRWRRNGDPVTRPPKPVPSVAEVKDEMREALDRLAEEATG